MAPVERDEALLQRYAFGAFRYFLENVNPENGLVADTTREGSPCSIAVVGFANANNRIVAGYQVEIDERFKL